MDRNCTDITPGMGYSDAASSLANATSLDAHSPSSVSSSTCKSANGEDTSSISSSELVDAPSPGSFGRRLIPQIIDSQAAKEPSRIVYSLASTTEDSLSFRHISALDFARAVDKTAWWLLKKAGKPESIRPVGYIGPHDLRHVLLVCAAVKVGFASLTLSPKNSTTGMLAVLEATNCDTWVSACDAAPVTVVQETLSQRPMKILEIPTLEELLDVADVKPYPFVKTFEGAQEESFCYLHTSGSTGVPKPIPWSHGLLGVMDAARLMAPTEGDGGLLPWTTDWKPGDRIYSSFPMSHGAGLIMNLVIPVLYNLHCIIGPANTIPNISMIRTLADTIHVDIWSLVPSLVEELADTPEVLDKFRPSKFICASGGPVDRKSAGRVNEVIRVLNMTGTTESLWHNNLVPTREDWFWFGFHPSSGFEFRQIDEETYEHWVHRHDQWRLFQGIFYTFPDKDTVCFNDLYVRHPTKPNLWAFKGRSDDIVVLSNGYKISALETETHITTHPAVDGCLIFGTGKPQAGLIIELRDPADKSEGVRESIWKTIEEANATSRHKNQLRKDFIFFAVPGKPFLRTDKRTVKRAATLTLYADEIERFYSSKDEDVSVDAVVEIDATSIETAQAGVLNVIRSSLHDAVEVIDLNTDLFMLGLDSLGAMAAVKSIRIATGLGSQISTQHIYANPTVSKLSALVVKKMAAAKARAGHSSNTAPVDDTSSDMARLIAERKRHRSFKFNRIDYGRPIHDSFGLAFFIPLREEASFRDTFDSLQAGLNRTFKMIPPLAGRIVNVSPEEIGYRKGDLGVSVPPPAMMASVSDRLTYNDLSSAFPSFAELREKNFPPSLITDELLRITDAPRLQGPSDVFAAQANFVEGGCILAAEFNHLGMDGASSMVIMRLWAENSRYLQGDESATCSWFDPESWNHDLPEILHEREGWARPVEEIDPGTWSFTMFNEPENFNKTAPEAVRQAWTLPPTLKHPVRWPSPTAGKATNITLFRIPARQIAELSEHVAAGSATSGFNPALSEIVQAFWWRVVSRARHGLATKVYGQTISPDDLAQIFLVIDARPYFSELLPATYVGFLTIENRPSIKIGKIASPETTVGEIAHFFRQASAVFTPQLVHDVFTLFQNKADPYADLAAGEPGMADLSMLMSNVMFFGIEQLRFGGEYFEGDGVPVSFRPMLHGIDAPISAILPLSEDGDVEILMVTRPEDLEALRADEEFSRYVKIVDDA